MKASELMVGDWVLDGKKPAQITGIICDDLFETTLSPSVGGECISPIPLTPEILEKNFNSTEIPDDPYGAYFYESNEYIEVYIKEYTDGLWEVVVDEIEFSSLPTWKMYVSNVHEIQHALRLCGFNKEIII